MFDFEECTPQDESSIALLREKAQELVAINAEISALEAELEQYNRRKNQLSCVEMVQIMKDLGMSEFKLDSGEKFKTEDFCSGSLNKAPDFRFAKNWLIDNGGGDLIKSTVSVDFGTGEHNMALSLRSRLEEDGFEVNTQEGVHPATYAAFGREKLKEYKKALEHGANVEEPPFRDLGLFAGTRIKMMGGKNGRIND